MAAATGCWPGGLCPPPPFTAGGGWGHRHGHSLALPRGLQLLAGPGARRGHAAALVAQPVSKQLAAALSPQLDQCLQEDFPVYKSFRFKGSIGPLRLHLVGTRAFARLREALGSPHPMPRVLREERLLHLIQSAVIS